LKTLVGSKNHSWRKVYIELARFNPVELEFRQSVRFTSDELVDVTVIKRSPQSLFLQ
jgi:hypothetical protein